VLIEVVQSNLRSRLQDWVNGMATTAGAQALVVVAGLGFVAVLVVLGFLVDRRRYRRSVAGLDWAARRSYVAEKRRESMRKLPFVVFYSAGALLTVGILLVLVASVAYWWLVGLGLCLVWYFSARPIWSLWVEPWWSRVRRDPTLK
jgi:hypothetical protein